jgi:peptidyl-prolyl cis-trans isomerase B (cyclophilin B)
MRRPLAPCAVLAVLALAGCGGGGGSSTAAPPSTASKPIVVRRDAHGCRLVNAPPARGPQQLAKPTARLDPAKTYIATVTTSCGTFAIRLAVKGAPKTAASFAYLARRRFYDGLTFHRVAAGFVIPGGDPLGNGTGGPGYSETEPPPASTRYVRGTVAMAKAPTEPPGTSGSQFFVVTAPVASNLTPDYALIGKVVSGLDVVQRIGAEPTSPPQDGTPLHPVAIESIRVR